MMLNSLRRRPSSSSSSSSPSHHVLRSRHGNSQRSSVANRVRQPHQLNANQQHVHLVKIKYCEDTRPGQQLEAAQWQHASRSAQTFASLYALAKLPS
eukprot:1151467-Pelagomonas_calceolata.AAC.2